MFLDDQPVNKAIQHFPPKPGGPKGIKKKLVKNKSFLLLLLFFELVLFSFFVLQKIP